MKNEMETMEAYLTKNKDTRDKFEIEIDESRPFEGICKGKFNKNIEVAVKKTRFSPLPDHPLRGLELSNKNIIYYYSVVKNSVRYLVMDHCLGSMLDYYEGRLKDPSIRLDAFNFVKKIYWGIAKGLDFLHRNNISHGSLNLKKILLCKINSKLIVKVAGYINSNRTCSFEGDLVALGNVFYAMATSNANNNPTCLPISADELVHRQLVTFDKDKAHFLANMINQLITAGESNPISTSALLMHPFFTINVNGAKHLLRNNLSTNTSRIKDSVNIDKLEEWRTKIDRDISDNFNSAFDELKTKLSENLDIEDLLDDIEDSEDSAMFSLFSEFIFYLSTNLMSKPGVNKFIEEKELSKSGSYGTISIGKWINEKREEIPAAAKMLIDGTEDDLNKEFESVRKLDNLFVIKMFAISQVRRSKLAIVMELCEGDLKDYVSGTLEFIPQNSVLDKIILGQVILGLTYIHSKGMIHKDLKPANILLKKNPTTVLAKLADFGYAKQLKPGEKDFSATKNPGTKDFLAPELLLAEAEGKPLINSFASDVYALGIVIAYVVGKGHPYGKDQHLLAYLMRTGLEPNNIGQLKWDVTDLILQLTKKEPTERPHVATVIYHPYFALTNENSKTHFGEIINNFFLIFEMEYESYDRVFRKFFDKSNIETWIRVLNTEKEKERSEEKKQALEKINHQLIELVKNYIEKHGENDLKIRDAIVPKDDDGINKSLDIRRYLTDVIKNLISTAPEFSVHFMWKQLNDKTGLPPFIPFNSNKHPRAIDGGDRGAIVNGDFIGKVDETHVFDCLKMTESTFGFLYLDEKMELFNQKHNIEANLNDQEIHDIIRELPLCATPEDLLKRLIGRLQDINSRRIDISYTNVFDSTSFYSYKEQVESGTVLYWMLNNQWWSNTSIVKDILERKADPNIPGKHGMTPVHLTAKNESPFALEIMKLLLAAGGNPNAVNDKGDEKHTPIHLAAQNRSNLAPEIMNLLLNNTEGEKGNPNVTDAWNFIPVHFAAQNSSSSAPKIMEHLLKKQENANISRNAYSSTALHYAANNQSSYAHEITRLLVEHGAADPNAVDLYTNTPLHYAAINKSNVAPEIMQLLLRNNGEYSYVDTDGVIQIIKPNVADENGLTPLHWASENESVLAPKIVELLLKYGENPNIANKSGNTVAVFAVMSNSLPEILKLFLDGKGDSKVEPNARNATGKSLLHFAVSNKSVSAKEKVKLLLDYGAKHEAKDVNGCTPLHFAVLNTSASSPEIVDALLKSGADPNTENKNKQTPVHFAAMNKSSSAPKIFNLLLRTKGNIFALDVLGSTPLDVANHFNTLTALLPEIADVESVLLGAISGATANTNFIDHDLD